MARSQPVYSLFIRLSFSIFSLVFSVCSLRGQNHFLETFNPLYQNIMPLRTDSIHIRLADPYMGNVDRFIRFKYGDPQIPEGDWVEIRSQSINPALWRIRQHAEITAIGKVIETEVLDSLHFRKYTERQTQFGSDPAKPDSTLYERKDSLEWIPVQKNYFQYAGNQVLNQTDARRNASDQWERSFTNANVYDQNKRLIQRTDGDWSNEQWNQQNQYKFGYKTGETKPVSVIWRNNGTPVDSTFTWYDGQSWPDSSVTFAWNGADWSPWSRTVFENQSQKQESQGHTFVQNTNGAWVSKENTEVTAGPGLYTNEPQEVITRRYSPSADAWSDLRRKTTNYQKLPGDRIYGTFKIEELKDGTNWEEVFFAEHWSTLTQFAPSPDSLTDRTNSLVISYKCGLSNPYVQYQTITFPESDAKGNYELKILSEEGQVVHTQYYSDNNLGALSADLPPGFYVVSVRKGATQLCLQKLIVK